MQDDFHILLRVCGTLRADNSKYILPNFPYKKHPRVSACLASQGISALVRTFRVRAASAQRQVAALVIYLVASSKKQIACLAIKPRHQTFYNDLHFVWCCLYKSNWGVENESEFQTWRHIYVTCRSACMHYCSCCKCANTRADKHWIVWPWNCAKPDIAGRQENNKVIWKIRTRYDCLSIFEGEKT